MSLLLHAAGFLAFAGLVLVLTQDLQIFPGALFSIFSRPPRNRRTLPADVESIFVQTSDGVQIEVWRLSADDSLPKRPFVGLAFHGNGGSLDKFLLLQLWFREMGMTSYGFDYRGFGKSSGWPSEEGIYRDSDAVWEYVLAREKVEASGVVVLGFSVGSAPAARISSLHQPRLLVLVSAFTSISDIIRRKLFLFSFLLPLCRYTLPTRDYIRRLQTTALLLLHSEKDRVVPSRHSAVLEQAYQGSAGVRRLSLAASDHNMVFFSGMRQLTACAAHFLDHARWDPLP